MKHHTAVAAQLDKLLQAVAEHSLSSWSQDHLMASFALFGQAAPAEVVQATYRLVSRELRTLVAARDVQAAALGAAIAQARAEAAAGTEGDRHD